MTPPSPSVAAPAHPGPPGATPAPGAPRWTSLQRRLHWAVALGVAGQYLLQGPMRRAVDALEGEGGGGTVGEVDALGFLVTTLHTWTGATIGLLLLWRLAVRRERARARRDGVARDGADTEAGAAVDVGAEAPDRDGPPLERARRILAAANHALLYLVTGAMVGSGALHWYAGVDAAARWHGNLKWALAGLVALHAAAAAWHALVRRDNILRSMTGRPGRAARLDRS